MELPQTAAFKVGAFVIAAIVLSVVIVATIGAGVFGQDKILLETYFKESVHGLSVGSPVKLRGVKVGTVEEITLARMKYGLNFDDPERLEWGSYVVVVAGVSPEWIQRDVGMSISDVLEHRIRDGLRAQLALEGISGLLYLEIDYTARASEVNAPPWKPHHHFVPAEESQIAQWTGALGRFLDKVDEIDIGRMARNLDELLVDLRAEVKALQLGPLVTELNAAVADVRGVLKGFQESGAIEDLHATAASLEAATARLEAILTGPEVERSLANVAAASDGLRETGRTLPALAETAHGSLERLDLLIAQEQTELARLIENLRLATRDLRRLSSRAAEHPSGVLFGDPPPPARPDQP